MPEVLNLHDAGELAEGMYIGRPSIWGNPFNVQEHGRLACIHKYERWLCSKGPMKQIGRLKGKNLLCYCSPHPCHGDVLLEYANKTANGEIFVFGSNLAGRHGAGSAFHAYRWFGACAGVGVGLHGHSYAIPTKDERLQSLSLKIIEPFAQRFVEYARAMPHLTFRLVAIGCGLAGYTPEQMAPMFTNAPGNVIMPNEFK